MEYRKLNILRIVVNLMAITCGIIALYLDHIAIENILEKTMWVLWMIFLLINIPLAYMCDKRRDDN